jgi:hypothetical protein
VIYRRLKIVFIQNFEGEHVEVGPKGRVILLSPKPIHYEHVDDLLHLRTALLDLPNAVEDAFGRFVLPRIIGLERITGKLIRDFGSNFLDE